jgi:hypothetical protein
MFKSNFHKSEFEIHHRKLKDDEYSIIPNGLRISEFNALRDTYKDKRDKYRFCYCSCYTRGLENILKYIWPQVVAIEPRAELHIYYGMNLVSDNEFKRRILELIAVTPNVMNHNKQPLDIIAKEKFTSSYQLYICNSPSEIDCISIREAVLCDCIPLIPKQGVFIERDGLRFDTNIEDPNCLAEIGKSIGKLINDDKIVNEFRDKLKDSHLTIDWKTVANKWLFSFCS